MNKLSFRVAVPPVEQPSDDLAPARGVMLAVALSVPLWWPTYVGLSCLAAWARLAVGWRP